MDPRQYDIARTIHVIGFVLWIGTLFAVARLLVYRDAEPDPTVKTRFGQAARKMAMLADIGATLAIIGGLWMLLSATDLYLKQGWMHIKLAMIVLVLALHGFIRVKSKRAAQGTGTFPRAILPALGLIVIVIVVVVIFKKP